MQNKKCLKNEETSNAIKCKIKVTPLKYLFHEANYILASKALSKNTQKICTLQ